MIKKLKFSSLIFLILLFGCAGLEFVYDNNTQKGTFLFSNTNIYSSGDNNILIKNQLEEILKKSSGTNKYILTIESKEVSTNLIIEDNQTATQIENTFIIKYTLRKQKGLCLINEKEITTSLDYKVKSSGYNFGSDLSKKNIVKKNINKNINSYLNYLLNKISEVKCINDNQS